MKILYLSSEAAPYIKVGGLGDVAGSLPKELAKVGNEVIQVLPFHKNIDLKEFKETILLSGKILFNSEELDYQLRGIEVNSIKVWFISGKYISDDEHVYGANDMMKYCFFSIAVIDAVTKMNWVPDIVHANDWHTAISLFAIRKDRKLKQYFDKTSALLSIHNLPYLGPGNNTILKGFGIKKLKNITLPNWGKGLPLPIGIANADWINTVSEGYAEEMLTREFGSGIHKYMRSKKNIISGILNGLDIEAWNPEADDFIFRQYSRDSIKKREENKRELLAEIKLPVDLDLPLLSIISRLDYQKGIDLVVDTISKMDEIGFQLVILGTGDPRIEKQVLELQALFPKNIRTIIKYDEALAHRIYSGDDMILIPSRYEPCGLTQMIGMRYGCIPIGANTGGLKDTVIDISAGFDSATGFLFNGGTEDVMGNAIDAANRLFRDKENWEKFQVNGMSMDFSWNKSIQQYQELYSILNKKRKQ